MRADPIQKILEIAPQNFKLLPLSPAQRKSWDYQKQDPESTFYNIVLRVSLEGCLQRQSLELAIRDLTRIHQGLGTCFVDGPSGPFQFQLAPDWLSLEIIDLRTKKPIERNEIRESLVAKYSSTPYKLDSGPLFRATLLQLSEEENELLLCSHQIISDGISCFVILRDLHLLYQDHATGKTPKFPEFKATLTDYISEQLRYAESLQAKSQLEYWKNRLRGTPIKVELPINGSTEVGRPPQSEFEAIFISPEEFLKIRNFCQFHGLTPFTFMLAAFKAALYLWSGQLDLVVGSMINNRSEMDLETWDIVGEFTNSVILRTKVSPHLSLFELLQAVKHTVLEAQANSICPFDTVVEAVNLERQLKQEPLLGTDSINLDFIMHNIESSEVLPLGPGVEARPTRVPQGIGHNLCLLDLGIELQLLNQGLLISCQYNRDKFQRESIQAFLSQFVNFAGILWNSPDESLASFQKVRKASA